MGLRPRRWQRLGGRAYETARKLSDSESVLRVFLQKGAEVRSGGRRGARGCPAPVRRADPGCGGRHCPGSPNRPPQCRRKRRPGSSRTPRRVEHSRLAREPAATRHGRRTRRGVQSCYRMVSVETIVPAFGRTCARTRSTPWPGAPQGQTSGTKHTRPKAGWRLPAPRREYAKTFATKRVLT